MIDFKEIIARWPSIKILASDLNEKPDTVRKWHDRNSVPSPKWNALMESARHRRLKLNCRELVEAAAE